MPISQQKLRRLLKIYPPYLGAGIRVDYISEDWRELQVSMKLRWYNRNAVGTHFGGSLYAMVDPHLMLMLLQILGKDYLVWDQSASITYLKPGKGRVRAAIIISDEEIASIRAKTESGEKYLPEFCLEIVDDKDEKVAEVKKVIYIRKKAHVG